MRPFSKHRQTGYRAQAALTSHPRQNQQQPQQEFHAAGIDSDIGTGLARPNKRAARAAASTLEAPPPAKRVRMVAPSSSSLGPSDVSAMSARARQGGELAAAATAAVGIRSGYGPMMISRPPRVLIEVDDLQRNRNGDGTLGRQSQDPSQHQSHLLPTPPPSSQDTQRSRQKQPPPSQQKPLQNQEIQPGNRTRTREPLSHQSTRGRQQQQQRRRQPLSLAHYMGYDHNINLAQYAEQTLVGSASGGEPAIITTGSATDMNISSSSSQAQTQPPPPANVANDDDDEQHQQQPQSLIAQIAQPDATTIATLQKQLKDATVAASKNKGIHHRSHRFRPRPHSISSSSSEDVLLLSDPFAPPSLRISKSKHKKNKTKNKTTQETREPRLTKSGVPYRRRRTQIELVMEAAIRAGFVEQVPNRSLVTGEPLVEEPLERFERKWWKGGKDVWEEELEGRWDRVGEEGGGEEEDGDGEEEGRVKSIGELLREVGIGARSESVGDDEDEGGAWDGDDEDDLYD